MRKIISVLILCLLASILSACGYINPDIDRNDESKSDNSSNTQDYEEVASDFKAALEDIFKKSENDNSSTSNTAEFPAKVKLNPDVQFTMSDGDGNVWLTNSDIDSVSVGYDEYYFYYLELSLTYTGRINLYNATNENIGVNMYIYADDTLISSPTVNETIDSDAFIISGNMTEEQVLEIYELLT